MENYCINEPRYERMGYRRAGCSGILLPEVSLGFWHNFGSEADYDVCKAIVHSAFDNGVALAIAPALYADVVTYTTAMTGKNAAGWIMGLQNIHFKVFHIMGRHL